MSTPELLGTDETSGLGWIGDTPRISDEKSEREKIERGRQRVKSAELLARLRPFLRVYAAIFGLVQRLHLWLQHESTEGADHERDHEHGEGPFLKSPARVKNLRTENRQCEHAADHVQREVTLEQNLRDYSRIEFTEDLLHVG